MSRRVRLTDARRRKARKAVEENIPYPGTVNQPGRQFKKWQQYHTFQQTVNHELPDMRHEWKDDQRDEIGFGIPEQGGLTVAGIRAAASKAVKLAVLLLGDKVAEDVVEQQARDFMSLGNAALDRALKRFAETEDAYTSDDEEVVEASEEKQTESEEEAAKTIQEEKEEKAKKEKGASEKAVKVKDKAKDKAKAKDKEEKAKDKEKEASIAELDIELQAPLDEEVEVEQDNESSELLATLYAQNKDEEKAEDKEEKAQDDNKKESSEKEGVKSLGGQPKVASDASPVDISGIWSDAPDVGDVFK